MEGLEYLTDPRAYAVATLTADHHGFANVLAMTCWRRTGREPLNFHIKRDTTSGRPRFSSSHAFKPEG
jgi:hypothetical protein